MSPDEPAPPFAPEPPTELPTEPSAEPSPELPPEPGEGRRGPAPFDPRMLEALVCPRTHGPLLYDAARQELVSRAAGLAYPIRDGIPVMLVDEARPLD